MARKKHLKFMVVPARGPNSDINVTPLVDVVLVLLIIFMVLTPLLDKDIEVRVPATEQVEEMSEVPPDQLVVSLSKEGELKINYQVVAPEQYVEKLTAILATKTRNEDKLVFFVSDDKTNYGKLVAALDGAKQAGAVTLGMMTEIHETVTPPGVEKPGEGTKSPSP